MKSTFTLAGDLELEITGNVPRTDHDPASVCLNLIQTHPPRPKTYETDLEVAASKEIDAYLASLSWSDDVQKATRDLVGMNIRHFFAELAQGEFAHVPLLAALRRLTEPKVLCQPIMATPGQDGLVQPPPECIASVTLKPSHARAIASAMLSAATEAKR